jgi:hypothetical protein
MKKVSLILIGMFVFLMSFTVKAQEDTKSDYFVGKWNILVEGTPQGDANVSVVFELKEGKLTGTILSSGKAEPSTFSRIIEKDKTVTAYYSTNGYDVYLALEKTDENNATGSMMDMFDAKATRVIGTK